MPYPLEDFYKSTQNMQPTVQSRIVTPDFSLMNRDAFKQAIPNISQMDEYSLSVLIKNNIDVISYDILNNDRAYAPLLRDAKFISALIRAVMSIPIDLNTKLACNKITYDYFTSDNPDPGIKQQYLNMSKLLNKDDIAALVSLGLDEVTACNFALCRNSSSNEKTNAKRLNFAMYFRDPQLMTEQMVVWIYEKLFKRASDLFQATMFEVYAPEQQSDFGENFMEVYGVVGLAVLLIVNNMTTDKIRRVLIGYATEWDYMGRPPVRFTLHALSNDFPRIVRVVDALTAEGYVIP